MSLTIDSDVGRRLSPHIVLISLYCPESFGIRSLFSNLRAAGYRSTAIFFKNLRRGGMVAPPTAKEEQYLIDLLVRLQPSVVGMSVVSPNYELASRLTKRIKQTLLAPVLWGGPHPTLLPQQCLTVADMICIGEGERAILRVADALHSRKELTEIPNLWNNSRHGLIKNQLDPLIEDLDSLPFLDRRQDDKYYIENNHLVEGDPIYQRDLLPTTYNLMTSRGCPFRCTYCCNSSYRRIFKGRYVRQRSVDNVIKELYLAKDELRLKRVQFNDDVFVLNKDWVENFCRRYETEIGLPFACLLHPESVKQETIALLADAGLDSVTIGIQAGSERVRKDLFERPGSNKGIKRAAQTLKIFQVRTVYDIILDNPFETEDDQRQTVELLLDLPRPFTLGLFSLCWCPETALTARALQEGVISESQVEGYANKAHTDLAPRLDRPYRKENQGWNSLVFLISLGIPQCIIRWLSQNDRVKRWPGMLRLTALTLTVILRPGALPTDTLIGRCGYIMSAGLRLLARGDLARIFAAVRTRRWRKYM